MIAATAIGGQVLAILGVCAAVGLVLYVAMMRAGGRRP